MPRARWPGAHEARSRKASTRSGCQGPSGCTSTTVKRVFASGARQPRRLRAGALDLVDGLRRACGEDLAARVGDEHVVLDADADPAQLPGDAVRDLLGLRLLFVFHLLGGGGAEAETTLPDLLLAVLAQMVG